MNTAKVAILRTTPENVLNDYCRLCELAGMRDALDSSSPTIIKDNISWHLFFPGANTTPWQLEGTILALKKAGLITQASAPAAASRMVDCQRMERMARITRYPVPSSCVRS